MRERITQEKPVEKQPDEITLKPGTVKQMIALYKAVSTARVAYPSGSNAYRLQMDLVCATADARNVQTAFEEAAKAIGMEL